MVLPTHPIPVPPKTERTYIYVQLTGFFVLFEAARHTIVVLAFLTANEATRRMAAFIVSANM
jgi:hypothetical protein